MKRLIILFLCSSTIYAQQIKVTQDFGIWGGVSLKKSVFSKYTLTFEHQFRTFHNSSKIDDYLFDTRLEYSINKHFFLSANLRYTHDIKRVDETENNFRYNFDIGYKKKFNPKITLRYRFRYQQEFVNPYPHADVGESTDPGYIFLFKNRQNKTHSSSSRNKLKLNYKYSNKYNLYASFEIFRLRELFRQPYFNKLRFFIGNNLSRVDLALGFEKELNSDYPYSFLFVKSIYKIKK